VSYFLNILINNVTPIIIIIIIGALLYRAFKLDAKTLAKLNFYLFSPAVIFKMIYESELSWATILQVLLFLAIFSISLFVVVEIVCRVKGYNASMKSAMHNSVHLYNSGNYAIPLNQLVFAGSTVSLSIQAVVMMAQNLAGNTLGIYSVNAHKSTLRATIRTIVSFPSLYCIPIAFILREYEVGIIPALSIPLDYVADAFISIALITLGVQIGAMKWKIQFSNVLISNTLRLLVGPALGFLVVWVLGMEGIVAQALVLSCAVPTSVLCLMLAVEFDNEVEFSSQAVLSSTLLSVFTVTFVISILKFI
jgi:predicted permease